MSEYIRHNWAPGEEISSGRLNNMEQGITEGKKAAEDSASAAKAAQEAANKHAARHAKGGADPITLEMLGAAPAGLIANNISCITNAEIENAITSEWSKMADNSIRHLTLNVLATGLTLFGGNWQITLHQASYAYGTLTAINYSYNGLTMQRNLYGGVWGEWEYVNPPMMLGQEYRTTERYNGNPVYTMVFDCGEVAVSQKQVTIPGVPAKANIFRYSGSMNDNLPLPHYYSYPDVALELDFNQSSAANEKYCIVHGSDYYVTGNVKVQIWYTKP